MTAGGCSHGGPLLRLPVRYTLGPQPRSRIFRNYLHSQCNLYGVIYMDGGSGWLEAFENVIANSTAANWVLLNGAANGETFQPPLRVYENWVDRPTFESGPQLVNCAPSARVNCTGASVRL